MRMRLRLLGAAVGLTAALAVTGAASAQIPLQDSATGSGTALLDELYWLLAVRAERGEPDRVRHGERLSELQRDDYLPECVRQRRSDRIQD